MSSWATGNEPLRKVISVRNCPFAHSLILGERRGDGSMKARRRASNQASFHAPDGFARHTFPPLFATLDTASFRWNRESHLFLDATPNRGYAQEHERRRD